MLLHNLGDAFLACTADALALHQLTAGSLVGIIALTCTMRRPGTQVVFTLNGETGKSVSQYASQWLTLVSSTKEIIRRNKQIAPKDVLVGVSLNYNKVYGWIDFVSISPEAISKAFDTEWRRQASSYPMDLPGMRKLYQAVDVIGVSAYPPLYPGFSTSALDTPLKYHEQELSYAGINLRQLINSVKKVCTHVAC